MKYPSRTHQELLEEISSLKQRIEQQDQAETERKRMEDELRASEANYRSVIENIQDVFYRSDAKGILLMGSSSGARIFGYDSVDEMIGLPLEIFWPDPMERQRLLDEIMVNGSVSDFEAVLKRKDGTRFNASFTTHFYYDSECNFLGTEGIIRDITDRKRSEEALRKSEASLQIVNAQMNEAQRIAGIGSWTYEFEKQIPEWSDEMFRIFGLDPGKGVPSYQEFRRLVHPDDLPGLDYEVSNTLATGKGYSLELRIIRSDGTERIVQQTCETVNRDGNRSPYILGTTQDITDRKRAEMEVIREKEKLQILSDNAPFGMVLINKEGYFTYINARFMELFGYELSEIPDGRTWFRKVYPDSGYRHSVISTWAEDFRHAMPGEQKTRSFTVTCKDGTKKTVEFIPSVLVSGDYLMTCEDITELIHLESQLRQAQKMESVGTLAGGIAHDFNNILTALMGYATLMQIKIDRGNPLRSYVDQILSASQKAADLTRSLLTFSRQQPITLAPLDINDTIKTTEKLLKRLLTEDIEMNTSLCRDDTVIMADRSQMDQILFNLVTNARDAMPKGGVLTVETDIIDMDEGFVGTHGFGEPKRYVLIGISDTGEGMDEMTREKIFDPFFTTKETGKGTGLGLATVYGIVKQHNGYITVYSEPGHGTIFRIYLPAVGTTSAGREADKATPAVKGDETILIAEDNEEVRRFIKEALVEYGYKTIEAVDGVDAVSKFMKHRDIDLAIVDSVMPKKNGREVYEEIRVINPNVRVLFTSGYTKDIVLNKGIEDGGLDFIAKPLSLNEFLCKVRELLDR